MPFYGPRDDQYDPAEMPLPENFDALPTDDQPLKTRLMQQKYELGFDGMALRTRDDWRRIIANYWGLCSLVDTHAGSILKTLDDCGLFDNTIIVFTSDHGDMMGSHRLLSKSVMFEEAARVPLLIHLPGQTASRRIRVPVSQVDLVPTLLDLMGQAIPGHLEGTSLRPALEKGDGAVSGDVFIEWNTRYKGTGEGKKDASLADEDEIRKTLYEFVRTIITRDGWKFNCNSLGGHELYNLKDDPLETTNLAARAEHQPLIQKLYSRIRDWQKRTDDKAALPEL